MDTRRFLEELASLPAKGFKPVCLDGYCIRLQMYIEAQYITYTFCPITAVAHSLGQPPVSQFAWREMASAIGLDHFEASKIVDASDGSTFPVAQLRADLLRTLNLECGE